MAWGDDDPVVRAGGGWGDDDPVATTMPKPKPKERGWREAVNDRGRAFRQGTTLGFGDELEGAKQAFDQGSVNLLRRATGKPIERTAGQAYRQTVDADRAQQRAFQEAHPVENVLYQIGGGLLTPGVGAAANYVRGANTLGGAVARSAAVGAGTGAVAGAGSADGNLLARGAGAAGGAVAGGLLGGAVPVAARAAQGAANMLRRTPVDEPAAMQQAAEALQEAGIDVRQVSTATMDRIRMEVRQGRDAREAALGIVANTELPVPLPMTRGQRTGQPGQQLSENLMLRGAKGSAASRQMRGFADEQQQALRGNVDAIAATVARGNPPQRNAGGAAVSDRLNTMYDEGKSGVDTAYRTARESGQGANLQDAPRLGAQLRQGVIDYDPVRVPSVYREIERLDAMAQGGPVAVRDVFEARQRLTALRASNDGVEASAARRAVQALDSHIGQSVEQGLLTGDDASVAQWRAAIGQRRDFGRLFESDDMIEALTERAVRGEGRTMKVDPGDATNYILGRSDMGFVGKRNLYRDINRLRDTIGADSPEWHGLRAEMFQRIASQGESGVEFGQRQFSGVKFQKAWQDFQRKDPRLASAMFSETERAQIERFATLAARVTNPVKGGDNSSNTAVTAGRMLGNLRFLRGLPFVKDVTNELEVQVNLSQARNATSPNVGRAARPASPPTGPLSSRVPAIVGQGSGVTAGVVRNGYIYWPDGTVEPE